jgi:hypothetical protein
LLSDALKPTFGEDALRWALLSTVVTWMISAACYFRAGQLLPAELARARQRAADLAAIAT